MVVFLCLSCKVANVLTVLQLLLQYCFKMFWFTSFSSAVKPVHLMFLFLLYVMCADHCWKIMEFMLFQKCEILHTEVWMTTIMFTAFLRVLKASVVVQSRDIFLYVDNWTACLQDTFSAEYKICALCTKLHKHDPFPEDWIWLNTKKDMCFGSMRLWKMRLPHVASSIVELYNDRLPVMTMVVVVGRRKGEMHVTVKQVCWSPLLVKLLDYFFYTYSCGRYDKLNAWNL